MHWIEERLEKSERFLGSSISRSSAARTLEHMSDAVRPTKVKETHFPAMAFDPPWANLCFDFISSMIVGSHRKIRGVGIVGVTGILHCWLERLRKCCASVPLVCARSSDGTAW